MATDRILALLGLSVGVIGLVLAYVEFRRNRTAMAVVTQWGADIANNIGATKQSVERLRARLSAFDSIEWSHQKNQVLFQLDESGRRLQELATTTRRFVQTVTNEENRRMRISEDANVAGDQ